MPCAYITNLANSIYKDIGSPSSPSVSAIQTKLVSEDFLGKLNVAINGCYFIVTGDISPALQTQEQAIYSELYKYDYYGTMAIQVLGAIGAVNWTRIKEGDSEIGRASPNETAKIFTTLKKQSEDAIRNLVNGYKANATTPQSIDYYTIDNNNSDNPGYWGAGGLPRV